MAWRVVYRCFRLVQRYRVISVRVLRSICLAACFIIWRAKCRHCGGIEARQRGEGRIMKLKNGRLSAAAAGIGIAASGVASTALVAHRIIRLENVARRGNGGSGGAEEINGINK
jgi:hypothetical protein